MKDRFKELIMVLLIALGLSMASCVVVKPYEMVNLNDNEMQLKSKGCDRFLTNFQAYREAASGANGGSTGGGCGCN